MSTEMKMSKSYILFYEEAKPRPEGAKGAPGTVRKHATATNPSVLRSLAADYGFVHVEGNEDHPYWHGERSGVRFGNTIRVLEAWIEESSHLEEVDESESDEETELRRPEQLPVRS